MAEMRGTHKQALMDREEEKKKVEEALK